mmetsp:Transcript_40022/g.85424  ORF Transcript_40022/g.85424 Transcript_40022/m.85424 type:complete len:210 (-) Transcript_40022:81-710(-)
MALVPLLQRGVDPVGRGDAAAAVLGVAVALPRGLQVAILRSAVVVCDLLARLDVTRSDHEAREVRSSLHEPARRVARVVHVVRDVHRAHIGELVNWHVVELGERLVLVLARFVHEVAVCLLGRGRQRIDPCSRARNCRYFWTSFGTLGPHNLTLAQAEACKEPHAAPHIGARSRHNARVNSADSIRGQGREQRRDLGPLVRGQRAPRVW